MPKLPQSAPPLPSFISPKSLAKVYLGIDPGKKGGLAWIDDEGNVLDAVPMPETERDIADVAENASKFQTRAVIEFVSASPQMGVTSSFTFGKGYGGLRMLLVAFRIPYEEIRPQTWMKEFSLAKKKDEPDGIWKKRLKAKAQQLFPKFPLWAQPRSEGKQLAVADALLIAEFCRRRYAKGG